MDSVTLESLDLNLLLVFEALAREQNVTRAADKVGLSQPAVSGALGRLRRLMGDPLFVRRNGRMQPTPRARQLMDPISAALAQLRQALEQPPPFDARTARHEFRIVTNDYVEFAFLAPLIPRILAKAPQAAIRTMRTGSLFEPPVESLQNGEAELAIGLFPETTFSSQLMARKLATDRFVCIVRKRHPKVRGRMDLRTFLSLPHARVMYPRGERTGMTDTLLAARNLARRIAVTVPHMLMLPRVVETSDCVALVPERVARAEAAGRGLRVFRSPLPMPQIAITMLWHQRTQSDPAQAWLREMLGVKWEAG
ncbi:MAG TPA: LysR family transcriptional regulator [Thermoanaerobaculia bacterium]|jgi:DNA-binding transcriptional LysR family regulator